MTNSRTIMSCAVAAAIVSLGSPLLADTLVFDAIPDPDPSSMPSWGFQAESLYELGNHVSLAGTARELTTARVAMVSWAQEDHDHTSGGLYNDPNITTTANGWLQQLTFNIYAVDNSGATPAVGSLLASKTDTFEIAWAPDASTHPVVPVTFDFTGQNVVLPDDIIFSIEFSTGSHGYTPTGFTGPYNSLNVGANIASETVGTDLNASNGVAYSTWTSAWHADDTAGSGFRFSNGADFTAGYQPAVEISAVPEPASLALLALGGGVALLRRGRKA